jgi:uncharacterized caspase-like protein
MVSFGRRKTLRESRDVVAVPTCPVAPATGRLVIATIGIDRYRHWRALTNAVGDATGAAALFRRLGFEEVVPPLLDDRATGEAIEALVADELTSLGASDSLIVFYAGHGGTRTQQVGGRAVRTGYLIPVDGSADARVTSWIEIDPWLRRIAKLPPRHILVILDACFSGIALSSAVKWGRDSGALIGLPFAVANTRPSRLVITSALDDEQAMDSGPMPGHSLFTGCLMEALTGGVPPLGMNNGRPTTIGSEIGRYVRNRVQTYPGRPGWQQTPDLGTFDYDERGEMLIPVLIRDDVVAGPTSVASGSAQISGPSKALAVTPDAAAIEPAEMHAAAPHAAVIDEPVGSAATDAAVIDAAAVYGAASRIRALEAAVNERVNRELAALRAADRAEVSRAAPEATTSDAAVATPFTESEPRVAAPRMQSANTSRAVAPPRATRSPHPPGRSFARNASSEAASQTWWSRRLRGSLFIAGVGVAVAVAALSGVFGGIIRRGSDAEGIPTLPPVSPPQTPSVNDRTAPAPDKPDGVARPAIGSGSSGPATVSSAPSAICPSRIESPKGAEVSWKDRVAIVPTVLPLPCGIEVSLTFRKANYVDAIRKVTAIALLLELVADHGHAYLIGADAIEHRQRATVCGPIAGNNDGSDLRRIDVALELAGASGLPLFDRRERSQRRARNDQAGRLARSIYSRSWCYRASSSSLRARQPCECRIGRLALYSRW